MEGEGRGGGRVGVKKAVIQMCTEPIGYISPQGALKVTLGELATSVDQLCL